MGLSVFPAADGGGLIQKSQTFNSSGTFTLPAGYGAGQPLIISALVCGGGGGGGGGGYTTSVSAVGGGGGGGSGVATLFENISLTANATITIGAGGAGGAGGGSQGIIGSSGGSSNINSTFHSPGGGGGGFGAADASGTSRGFSINSFGYNIQGGNLTGIRAGGGAGGSGGQASNTSDTNPTASGVFFAGGSYGDSGINMGPGGTAISTQLYNSFAGSGVRRGIVQSATDLTASPILIPFVPDVNQPGGGGAGGYENTSPLQGQAGSPGTRIGGLNGFKSGTQKDAVAATTPGAGGGGGGGSYNNGGRGGNGGAGGTGFVTIYWWG